MKKDIRKFPLGIMVILLLHACGGTNGSVVVPNENQGEISDSVANVDSGENNTVDHNSDNNVSVIENGNSSDIEVVDSPASSQFVATDPLPLVEDVHNDPWFKPTNPNMITAASGQLQFVKFSAVW